MARQEPAVGLISELKLDKELIKGSVVHANVGQELLITTADKLRLCLRDYADALKSKNEWHAPLGMLVAFWGALVAADFKAYLGLNADFWRAMFSTGAVLCGLWLVASLLRLARYRDVNIETIVRQLKEHSHDDQS